MRAISTVRIFAFSALLAFLAMSCGNNNKAEDEENAEEGITRNWPSAFSLLFEKKVTGKGGKFKAVLAASVG